MRLHSLLILILLLFPICANAQIDAQLSQYWALPGYLNPAAIASGEQLTVSALSRLQWVGMPNAPKTFLGTAEMPFRFMKRQQAVGLLVISDQAGLFSHQTYQLQYAVRFKWGRGTFSTGIRLGATDQTFDGTKIEIPESEENDSADEAIPRTRVSAMAFDAALGVSYQHPCFTLALSSTHLTSPELELDQHSYIKLDRLYYLTGTGNIVLRNPLYELQPGFLLKSDLRSWQTELTMRMLYKKVVWGGISWRRKDAVVFLAGGKIGRVTVGYAYDLTTSAVRKAAKGSHELFVTYQMPVELGRKGNNRYKSIRIL